MGFLSFMKKVIGIGGEDDPEIIAARARHGINVDEVDEHEHKNEQERFTEEFDVWDEIRNIRMNFFIGNWASKKFRIIGEDKVKKQLAELEKKRDEEGKRKGEGEKL
jgi:hypothetical protein